MAGAPWRPSEVSVVIPAWNDHQRLESSLRDYLPAIRKAFVRYELLVVSDGEKEPTRAVVSQWNDSNVALLEFPERKGKGGAVIAGLAAAKYATVGFVDADGPVSPEDLVHLAQAVEHSDVVVASRAIGDRSAIGQRLPSRRFFSRCWNLAVRVILGLRLSDTQCGAKFFRREVAQSVIPRVSLNDWAFDVSLLFHLQGEHVRILEVPVALRSSSESKLDTPRVIPFMLLSLAGVRLMDTRIGRTIPDRWVTWFLRNSARA